MKAILIGVMLAALTLAGCSWLFGDRSVITGSGPMASEARSVSGFDAIALLGSGEVVITQGTAEGLTIEAEDNLLPLITSQVRGGTLELGFDRANWADVIRPTQPIRFLVSVRDLTAIDLAGSGDISGVSLSSSSLQVTISGSGNVRFDQLNAGSLEVTLTGSGSIALAGQVDQQTISIPGSGDYEAGDLESQAADVTLGGSGNVTVWVHERLEARIGGSGTINYFGTPTVGQRDITGSGDINPMGDK